MELIAELATSHGGDVDLACDMVAAAADAGAHTVKIQSYTLARLNPKDPQAEWLTQSYLDEAAHVRLIEACAKHKVEFLSTPFDRESFAMLKKLGLWRFKVASTGKPFSEESGLDYVKSWPWGARQEWQGPITKNWIMHLTAIPLYPTPLEAVSAAPLLDGWSDHTIGTAACKHMISKGARIIEAHFCLPGRSRQMSWDKSPSEFREIRDWADAVETMTTGVSQTFRDRWKA
jgi:N,N'-diacetyllegionaminate synthase